MEPEAFWSPGRRAESPIRLNGLRTRKPGDVIALHPYRALYYAIPKVANSSLKALCVQLLSGSIGDALEGLQYPGLPFFEREGRRRTRELGILLRPADARRFRAYRRFAFVRNPWDRLVSCYVEKILPLRSPDHSPDPFASQLIAEGLPREGVDFGAFVDRVCVTPDRRSDRHVRAQVCFIADRRRRLVVDRVGRFERFAEDAQEIFSAIGAGPVELPHGKRSVRRDYRDYYTPALRDRVAERYAADVRLFGYAFRS